MQDQDPIFEKPPGGGGSVNEPAMFGEYALERMLGRGGMGEVWLARDTRLDRMVAIKTVRPDFVSAQGAVQRFQQEARAIARLNHPNIVSVYQLGEDRGTHFFVMEYVDGESLADMLARTGPLEPRYCLGLMSQVAAALDYAAGEGILHRDIKPGNIMTDRFGRARVGDFGLAKMLEADVNMTTTGVAMGSPNYMSPESARGELLDARSDMYSLGITMFHLLMGYLPFTAQTAAILLVRHMQDPLPEPPELAAMEGGRVLDVVRRLTAKAREARFPDFGELKQEIDDILANGSTRSARVTAPAPASAATLAGTAGVAPTNTHAAHIGFSATVPSNPLPTGPLQGSGGMMGNSTLSMTGPSGGGGPTMSGSSGSIIIETKPRTFLVLGALVGLGVAVVAAAGFILFRAATQDGNGRRDRAVAEKSAPAAQDSASSNVGRSSSEATPTPVASSSGNSIEAARLLPADLPEAYIENHRAMRFDEQIKILEKTVQRTDLAHRKRLDAVEFLDKYRKLATLKAAVVAAIDKAPPNTVLRMPSGGELYLKGRNSNGDVVTAIRTGEERTYPLDNIPPPVFVELVRVLLPQEQMGQQLVISMYPPRDGERADGMPQDSAAGAARRAGSTDATGAPSAGRQRVGPYGQRLGAGGTRQPQGTPPPPR